MYGAYTAITIAATTRMMTMTTWTRRCQNDFFFLIVLISGLVDPMISLSL